MKNKVKYFDTERDAEKHRKKYKTYKGWVVQGNSLVKVGAVKLLNKVPKKLKKVKFKPIKW